MARAPAPRAGTPAGPPSIRARTALLEYAATAVLAGSEPGTGPSPRPAVSGLLEQLAVAFGARAALVIAPGTARPVGQQDVYPDEVSGDIVLLAQVRAAWAAHGAAAAASGEPFEVEIDSVHAHEGLLVVPAVRPPGECPVALALVGPVTRWKTGARATLRALATIVAAGPAAAEPAARQRGPAAAEPAGRQRGPADADALAQALVAGSPQAIVAVDANRRIVEFNPAAQWLFGRARADVLGRDMPQTLVPERLRPAFVDAMAAYLARGDRTKFGSPVPLRALRADGTERPITLTPIPVTVAGETYFFGFMQDTAELEAAAIAIAEGDARFRLLSDLAPVGIVQTDVNGTTRFVNDHWTALTGIPADQIIGQNWRSTINPEDVGRLDAVRSQTGTPTELAADCRLRTAAGGEIWVHAVVRRVEDSGGTLVGRVAVLTDVHTRKRQEAAGDSDRRHLAEQNVELREQNEATGRYLATASHELRTPLTSIVSFAELIRSEPPGLDGEPAEYLDIIQRNAERLLRVVGHLLDLTGLEEGVARLDLRAVSVPEAVREAVRAGRATAAGSGVKLDISAEDGPDVQADGDRLQQVLDNLISNAVKFSVDGGRVEVRATHDAQEWRIAVADGGIGIPPSEVDRLFDRFFRASNARAARVPGTGLGLPTAKVITELHGGRIEVASVIGAGTTVTVVLPVRS
jgi:PAS domain S-box-containing protein